MKTFTISLPTALKEALAQHPDINWAEYLKKQFLLRLVELRHFEELKNRGKLSCLR